jgi:Cof subfamily protein (haloacid dehalogenase superfamily)
MAIEDAAPNGKARLIALDLDGTLLVGGNRVSDANAAAVREAVAAGVHIVFATSRWFKLAKHTADMLGVTAPIICHNGAMIRNPADGAYLLHLALPPDAALDIAALADERRFEGMVTVDDETLMITKRPDIDPARLPGGMRITERLSDHVANGAEAFLFFGTDAVEGIPSLLGKRYADVCNFAVGWSATWPHYLNIVHRQADKGRALRMVCEHVGVAPEQAMAIGDAAPDLEMMKAVGIGMAMGNAPDDVKAQADVVGPGNLEDGVAWAIRTFAL